MSKGQKHTNLLTCHAARINLPKEILLSFERLLLSELTVHILSDFELYRILKNDADSVKKQHIFSISSYFGYYVVQISRKSHNGVFT